MCGLRVRGNFCIRENSHGVPGREVMAVERVGEYQDPGRGAGLSRRMAGRARDKGLTGEAREHG